jgi:peptide/nickel transport system substrate-binding protein
MNVECVFMDRMMMDNWTLNPSTYGYNTTWRPPDYLVGDLATSWEFTNPGELTFHLRQGVHFQNLAPVYGREFTSADVLFEFDQQFGLLGSKPPVGAATATYVDLQSMTAPDKYTVVFKWKTPNNELILETLLAVNADMDIVPKEVIQTYGHGYTWQHAVGTGPFEIQDYVTGSSATFVKNPDYWGYDERNPKNKLPYVDSVKYLIIPDNATAMAAMRTGKIDSLDGLQLQQVQQMQKTNPELKLITGPDNTGSSIDPRNDVAPFNDIRVREAMQMAIDLKSLATNFYSGMSSPNPLTLAATTITGWSWPYDQWPQDLKDQYAYNPTAAKKLLADAGYPNGFNTNVVAETGPLQADLLQVIQQMWAAIGINLTINIKDSASWTDYVRNKGLADQIVMRNGGSLSLGYEPSRMCLRFQKGYSTDYAKVDDPTFNAAQAKFAAAATLADQHAVVQSLNELVARQHFVISLVASSTFSESQPWFKGYLGQSGSVTGTGTGPNTAGFYLARFWSDTTLKKSLGH